MVISSFVINTKDTTVTKGKREGKNLNPTFVYFVYFVVIDLQMPQKGIRIIQEILRELDVLKLMIIYFPDFAFIEEQDLSIRESWDDR